MTDKSMIEIEISCGHLMMIKSRSAPCITLDAPQYVVGMTAQSYNKADVF